MGGVMGRLWHFLRRVFVAGVTRCDMEEVLRMHFTRYHLYNKLRKFTQNYMTGGSTAMTRGVFNRSALSH